MTGWESRALCARLPIDPAVWFPDRAAPVPADVARFCAQCPVRQQCLATALALAPFDDLIGIRGGLNVNQRNRLRTTRNTHRGSPRYVRAVAS